MPQMQLPHRFFALLHKAVFATDRHANALFTKERANFSEFLMLNALEHCDDSSQQRIAEFLNLTPAAVSRRVDSLVTRKLAVRTEDPRSRRTNRIVLTKAGRAEIAKMQKVLAKGFKSQVAAVSDKDMRSTCRVLETLLDSFK
jgi:DNA-binding MarR family transcriptional regulator